MATPIPDAISTEVSKDANGISSKSPSSKSKITTRTRSKFGSEGQSCFSQTCINNSAQNPRIHFFNFPKDEERCWQWVRNVQRSELEVKTPEEIAQNYVLCSEHFEDEMFVNPKQKQRLTPDAVPTIFEHLEENSAAKAKKRKRQTTPTVEKSATQRIAAHRSSPLVCHAIRVMSGEDLKFALECYINRHELLGAFVLSCVGSVKEAELRMADSTTMVYLTTPHEILSLNGTLSAGGHLHICLSDGEGKVIGGHLKNAIIHTTAEVVIGELPKLAFRRLADESTNYKELVVQERKGNAEAGDSGREGDSLYETMQAPSRGTSSPKKGRKRKEPKSTVKLVSNENGIPTVSVNNTLLKITHM